MAEKKPVKITETVLRDAHQSLIATRMTTEQMLPIIDKMDKVGYHSVECWGGATFDACLRFLKEDPWERLRKLRDGFKNTKLQMLFRGQNILGYRHYADDVVEYFVQKSIANGIDIIRIFDCLNDIRNLETAVKACNKEKGHAQVALSYTLGDAYTLDYWKDMAKRIEDMGADSICIKDMAGLLVPYKATELVQALKEGSSLPIQLHTHYTSGVASMTYMKAVEAGCDIIDTAISPLALGTSQPATEVMAKTFEGTPYDPGFDQNLLAEIADYFRPLREEWIKSGLLNPKVLGVNVKTLLYQVPGGMLSNLVSQLKEMNAEDKFEQVLEQEVNDAVGLPVRMLVYNADRYLFDIEQHGADAHDAEQHAVRENLGTVHERYAERNAREIEQYADESVVAEYRFAYLFMLEAGYYIQEHRGHDKDDAYADSDYQNGIYRIHNAQRL